MIDRFGKEIDFSELFMEETLSAKDKKELPDSMYGLVYTDEKGNKVRKFPLNDESHVRQAAIFFDRAKDLTEDQKRELARNIVRRAKELDMDYSGWESLKPYLDKADKPIKESFEEMFGPVIQEAFDAVTGEEIPIKHAYTMEEMAKITLSLNEAKDRLIPIKPPKTDEVYFGSPTNHMPEIELNRPLFVSPYKGIASIFIWGDMGLQDRIPKGSYNLNYEEWINFDEKKMNTPLKEVHVYLEGAPFLEPFTVEQEGYIHCISTKDYLNNFFRKPWMTKDLEYLIANTDNMKVEFTRSIKCKVNTISRENQPQRVNNMVLQRVEYFDTFMKLQIRFMLSTKLTKKNQPEIRTVCCVHGVLKHRCVVKIIFQDQYIPLAIQHLR